MQLTTLRYALYSVAAALIAAGESFKGSGDNVPDEDGVLPDTTTTGATVTEITNTAPPSVDSTGLPWDERIHSGGKSIKADGTWTKKKGATPPVVAAVEAELRARAGGTPAALPAPTPTAPAGVPLPAIGGLALPTPGAAPALTNYQKLVAYLAAKTGPGKAADDAWVNAAFAGWGLTLAGMATDEVNSEAVLAQFKAVLGE